ncbi:MAG TPA: hypothetical protein VHL79_24610 [Ramlibacter sp.]|jgi:hypothetical protein|nr:hypothetical protein [Ramlibacter sp.]
MNRKILLAALAAGSLLGAAGVANAVPAVVAPPGAQPPGTIVYGHPGPATVYTHPGQVVLVQPAPPAPIYEAVPATREGYLWAPGHYVWDNGRYTWRAGQWIATRPGYAWQAARWEQRSDGSWYLVGGTWVRTDNVAGYDDRVLRDRDGDGVINRNDRFPRDPGRW